MTKLTDELLAEGMSEAAIIHAADTLTVNGHAYPLAPDSLCGAIEFANEQGITGTGSCVFPPHLGGGPHSWENR